MRPNTVKGYRSTLRSFLAYSPVRFADSRRAPPRYPSPRLVPFAIRTSAILAQCNPHRPSDSSPAAGGRSSRQRPPLRSDHVLRIRQIGGRSGGAQGDARSTIRVSHHRREPSDGCAASQGACNDQSLGAGKTVKEIADELSLSVKTVSTYRSPILEKTGMRTTADLIRYGLQEQLVY